ncbi:Retrotransposable element Tf2 protein [Rhizoctonia solani]|uniref:Retrotransposable element Tf2 protein n=1 Tax=Rhizoctonia solani TaxID=456999 RepID=A0A8H8NZC1_9AGAM|nr:Retrotransposable element Tf2 protein [Rhizoctonia solani]QRW21678.1 Retrotransposable element Tf2 protein [Rhizoctonia solani]
MGAILSQQGPDNRLHPIAYMSKSFSGAKANYDTHNKELLAIIKALEEWQTWSTGCKLAPSTAGMLDGKQSGKPDALSRRSDYKDSPQEPKVMIPPKVFVNTRTSEEGLATTEEIHSLLREDPSLEPIICFLTEDMDNALPSIRKAYREYDWCYKPPNLYH